MAARNTTTSKIPATWILIADGKKAEVYVRQKIERQVPIAGNAGKNKYEVVTSFEHIAIPGMKWEAESPKQYEVGRHKQGQVFESIRSARHKSEPHMVASEEVEQRFAINIAENINKAKAAKSFERLVLIAPAKMLGSIKKQLDKSVLDCIISLVDKDLTHFEGKELSHHLEKII